MTISEMAKQARKTVDLQTTIRQDAIARLGQVIELIRDIPRLNAGDHEAATDAISDLKLAIMCIKDINGEDE